MRDRIELQTEQRRLDEQAIQSTAKKRGRESRGYLVSRHEPTDQETSQVSGGRDGVESDQGRSRGVPAGDATDFVNADRGLASDALRRNAETDRGDSG